MSSESDEKLKVAKRPHGLGRGLSALLGDVSREEPVAPQAPSASTKAIQSIEVALIQPHPEQPRRHFDDGALAELADSIGKRGVIQPIIVRPHGGGFQIVAGERRWRAAQRAQLHRIPAIVRDFDEAETLEIALVENIQREDLNPIEEAEAYRKLIADFHHSQRQVVEQKLSMGHARALIGAPDCETLAQTVEAKGLSVRDTEELVRRSKKGDGAAPRSRAPSAPSSGKDPDIAALEQHLADILGVKVEIGHGEGAGGTLSLRYSTLDQLDMLCQRLSGERI